MPDKSPSHHPPARHADQAADLSAICEDVAAGLPGALERLHARLSPGLIRHFTRKLGGQPAVAEELAQQAWIAFWQALTQGKYDPAKSRPSTFLYAVSGNIWLRHLRAVGRARPEQRLSDRDSGQGSGAIVGSQFDDPADAASEASAIDLVRSIIQGHEPSAGLSDDERLILRAIAVGRTDRELAAELGVAPSTAHARKKVATEKLRVFLESRGITDGASERPGQDEANN